VIIKAHKGRNELIIGLIFLFLVLLLNFRPSSLEILVENFREKILTYDLGFSRWHNISDSSSEKSQQLISVFKKMPSILYNNIIGYDRNHIEKLDIDIKFLDYKIILSNRDQAIKNEILRNPNNVSAVIKFKNQKYKASIRLKGDLSDHWTSVNRLSLRINLKGDNTIHGLNEFNIQKPRTRSYPYDAAFQDTLRSTGSLATEHNYVNVSVNGEDWGVMNLESHIDKEFLERNKKKDSLVVRFSNEDGWFYEKTNKNFANKYYRLSNPRLFSKVYNSAKNFDITRRNMYTYIVEERIKNNSELYDIDSYTRLFLLARLWGEMHVLYENNTKHYLNPYTLKLEPISSDQYQPKKLVENGDVFNLFGTCSEGYAFVMNELYQTIKNTKKYSSNLTNNYHDVLNKVSLAESFLKKHHGYFPLDNKPSKELLDSNIKMASKMGSNFFNINEQCIKGISSSILTEWNETKYNLPHLTQAFHYDNGRVKLFNLLPSNIKILGIRVDNEKFYPLNIDMAGHDNKTYKPYIIDTNLTGIFDERLEIVSSYQGVTKYQQLFKTLISDVNNPLNNDNIEDFKFVIKKTKDTWVIPSGKWVISSPMFVKGNLIIEPGVELLFDEQAYLSINGAIIANGNDNQQIKLTSRNKSWMGLYVHESPLDSILKNVYIDKTSTIDDGLLKLSGGVTFYNANVSISNSHFAYSLAEDMLNIVKSNYVIKDTVMSDSKFDALDSDFSKGSINNLTVENVGGDAIDTSGTNLKISNLKVNDVVDKALSAGESSNISVNKCNLQNIGVGVASKDGSNVSISNCQINNAKLSALMSYKKKGFYGQPKMDVRYSNFDVDSIFIRQRDADLLIDGVLVPYSDLNVEELYQSTFMKK
jgi:hypothetical protein